MTTTSATLGGEWLDDRAPVSWTLRSGTDPFVAVFSMDRAAGAKLLPGGKDSPYRLKASAYGQSLDVSSLYVLGEGPRMDPWTTTLLVADERIWWARKHIRKSFNIRRRSGQRRRVDDDSVDLVQVQGEIDDITFRKSSLNNGEAWKARDMVKEVLDLVTGKRWSGDLSQFPQSEVADLELDDGGNVALARALEFLPGSGVFVDRHGVTIVSNELDAAAEARVVDTSGPAIEGGGIPAYVDLRQQRPKNVNVLFTPEQELRFDYTATDPRRQPDQLLMENVYPCPDERLKIDGRDEVLIRGEYARADEFHAAWGIDEAFIRRYWSSTLMEEKFGLLGKLTPDENWPARISTIRNSYRQLYRIPKTWMDRIESFRSYRCSVIDLEAGTFGASPVWQDWAVTPSANGLLFGPSTQFWVTNMPDGVEPGDSLTGSPAASFRTQIVDMDLGIIAITRVADYQGNWGILHPSAFDLPGTAQKRQTRFPISLDGLREGRQGASLSLLAKHRASTIISAVPASPNSRGKLYEVRVPFSDARARLPARSQNAVPSATGPDWDIRVTVTTARFAWSHGLGSTIRNTFGAGIPDDQIVSRASIERLLCNPDEIKTFAETVSAALYSSMPDHYEGSKVVLLNQSIIPEGRIQSVTHSIETDGAGTTTIVSPGPVRAEDPMALLPDSARKLIQRQVQI